MRIIIDIDKNGITIRTTGLTRNWNVTFCGGSPEKALGLIQEILYSR